MNVLLLVDFDALKLAVFGQIFEDVGYLSTKILSVPKLEIETINLNNRAMQCRPSTPRRT